MFDQQRAAPERCTDAVSFPLKELQPMRIVVDNDDSSRRG
jgi:hypothetical protein